MGFETQCFPCAATLALLCGRPSAMAKTLALRHGAGVGTTSRCSVEHTSARNNSIKSYEPSCGMVLHTTDLGNERGDVGKEDGQGVVADAAIAFEFE
jgi:hypothetical protein